MGKLEKHRSLFEYYIWYRYWLIMGTFDCVRFKSYPIQIHVLLLVKTSCIVAMVFFAISSTPIELNTSSLKALSPPLSFSLCPSRAKLRSTKQRCTSSRCWLTGTLQCVFGPVSSNGWEMNFSEQQQGYFWLHYFTFCIVCIELKENLLAMVMFKCLL